jgi:membrane-bound inhibitor of C-type lysozyme
MTTFNPAWIALTAAIVVGIGIGNAEATEASYECSKGTRLTAQFSPPSDSYGRVALTFAPGRTITLPQAASADGGRYADGDMEFWIKGRSATLTRNGSSESCTTR